MDLEICYLCGEPIRRGDTRTEDHVVPATLIERAQPKVKGFDYAGKLPSHQPCNNHFGGENYVAKGLKLLSVLHSPETAPLQHAVHPEITVLPLDASKLSGVSPRDLRFFKLIDSRSTAPSEFSDPAFYVGRVKTDPLRDALLVVLSVLAKSAAALLVKRHLTTVPLVWRVYAQPYIGDLTDYDLGDLLGDSLPFDTGVRAWVAPLPNGNYQVIYAASDALIYFTFAFNDRRRLLGEVTAAHAEAETWVFVGTRLVQLMTAGWRRFTLPTLEDCLSVLRRLPRCNPYWDDPCEQPLLEVAAYTASLAVRFPTPSRCTSLSTRSS